MSEAREWLNEREIDGKILKVISDEQKDWRDEVREHNARQEELVRNGTQASLNVATLLTGNEQYGIKGFMPEVRERLDALEAWAKSSDAKIDEHHQANSGRLDRIERFSVWSAIVRLSRWLTADGTEWKRVGWLVISLMWLMTTLSAFFPGLRVWAVKLAKLWAVGR